MRNDFSSGNLNENEILSGIDAIPTEYGDANVVIAIARWSAKETIQQWNHDIHVLKTALWVEKKVRTIILKAQIHNGTRRLTDESRVLDQVMVTSLYSNPGPLRKKFRSTKIDSFIRAANFYLSLPSYDTQKPSR